MHKVDVLDNNLRSDLILENKNFSKQGNVVVKKGDITVTTSMYEEYKYITIYFRDITDKDDYLNLEKCLLKELKKLIKIREDDVILVIGLGNEKATPDALGPETVKKVLVTRYLIPYGLSKEYRNVSVYRPDVYGNTGIESSQVVLNIVRSIKATKVIFIDALKASCLDRLNKTIQITNKGINPGSGIYNDRGELSSKNLGCEVYAIGIPTVVDIKTIMNKRKIDANFIVTPTDIDFFIEKASSLISVSLNKLFHTSLRQIKK